MIRVLHIYQGVPSGDKRIHPGEYANDDPALFGLADYLVDNRHAEAVDEPIVEETVNDGEPVITIHVDGNPPPDATLIAAPLPNEQNAEPLATEEADELQPSEVEAEVSLDEMTKADLKAFATDNEIELGSAKNNEDIANAIHAAFAEADGAE